MVDPLVIFGRNCQPLPTLILLPIAEQFCIKNNCRFKGFVMSFGKIRGKFINSIIWDLFIYSFIYFN